MSVVNSRRTPVGRPVARWVAAVAASAGVVAGCAAAVGVPAAAAEAMAPVPPTTLLSIANTGFAIRGGTLYTWGENDFGQGGVGVAGNEPTPVAVSQGAIPDGVSIEVLQWC